MRGHVVVDFTITASVKGAELKYEQAGDIANAAEIAKVSLEGGVCVFVAATKTSRHAHILLV